MRNSQPESPVSSISERLSGADPRTSITQLFESMRPDLLRFAHWLARDRSLAEDIVQESLLRAWRSRDTLKDRGAARAWLLTIVRREPGEVPGNPPGPSDEPLHEKIHVRSCVWQPEPLAEKTGQSAALLPRAVRCACV